MTFGCSVIGSTEYLDSKLKAIKTDMEKEIAGLKARIENVKTANESFGPFSHRRGGPEAGRRYM